MKLRRIVLSTVLPAILLLSLCACSAQTETPSPSAPSQTADTAGNLVPAESASIKLSISFMLSNGENSLRDSRIYEAATEYMRRHPDVHIDLRDTLILSDSDAERYVDNLTESLSAGTSADIAFLDNSFPVRKIAAEATLVDFEELIEKDNEVKRTDFFENILDAVKFEDALYVMPLTFTVDTFVMNKEYTSLLDKPFDEYSSLDFRDMMKVYEKAIESQNDGDKIYLSNSSFFRTNSFYAMDLQSLDYDTGSIDIYNESKRDLVEKAANLPRISTAEASRCRLSDFFYSPQVNLIFANQYVGGGGYYDGNLGYEDFKYTNSLPFADFYGDIHFMLNQSAVISRNCTETETAWDFLKFIMGYDENDDESEYIVGSFYQGDPIRRELFREFTATSFEYRYDVNLEAGRISPYTKQEAIENTVAMEERKAELATKRSQSFDFDISIIWNKHYNDYISKTTTTAEMLKALERDLLDLLAKY